MLYDAGNIRQLPSADGLDNVCHVFLYNQSTWLLHTESNGWKCHSSHISYKLSFSYQSVQSQFLLCCNRKRQVNFQGKVINSNSIVLNNQIQFRINISILLLKIIRVLSNYRILFVMVPQSEWSKRSTYSFLNYSKIQWQA